MPSPTKLEYPILSFETSNDFRQWLVANHNVLNGIWLRFYKKNSGVKTIVYKEALDEALCFGWIDGQLKTYDEVSYIQKFIPRRPKSNWSKLNIAHVARLEKEGKMEAAGIKAVDDAKMDGRWERAYDSPSQMELPEDFRAALEENPNANAFYESLNKNNKFAIAYRLHTAKRPETRAKRFNEYLDMLAKGKKLI